MSRKRDDIPAEPDPRSDDASQSSSSEGRAGMPPRVGRREPYDTGETLPLESRRRGALEAQPRLSGTQQRRNQRRRSILAVIGAVVVVIAIALVAASLVWIRTAEGRLRFPAASLSPIDRALTSVRSGEQTYTALVLGVDGSPSDQSQPLHAVMLLRVTPTKVSALSLAPDIAVRPQVPQSPTDVSPSPTVPTVAALGDIAKVGGYPAVVDTIERSFGTPVNHLIAVRGATLGNVVDSLGGVWMTVPRAIADRNMSKLGGAARVDAGKQLLDGAKAVTVVRALPETDSQLGLMARQRLFLSSLAASLAAEQGRLLGPKLAARLGGGMLSDMPARDLSALLLRLEETRGKIESASLWGTGEAQLKDLDPTVAAKLVDAFTHGTNLAKASPTPPKGPRPGSIVVTVRNGSGVSGLAAQAASMLKGQGYRVRGVGNADQFVYDETLIVYKSNARMAAETLRKSLPVGRLVPSRGMYAFDTPVLIVVGKDWQTTTPEAAPVPIEQP